MKKMVVLVLLALSLPAWASDWTQFRGPGGSGASEEKGLPVKWGPDAGLRWKIDLPGRGLSSPVIVGNKVILTACSGFRQSRLHVLCLDAANGKKLWERQFTSTGNTQCHPKTSMAAPTPATDGKAVYALFATGDLAALDLNGDLLWYRSLVGDYPDITNQVGMASSPVLYRGMLLLPMENAGTSFAAGVDTKTGANKWKVERARKINWVTPIVWEKDGKSVAVFQTNEDVTAYDPETGKEVWTVAGNATSEVVSPTRAGDLLLIGGRDFLALKPGEEGSTPDVAWKSSKLQSSFASPVVYQDRLYVLTSVGLRCADLKDGKEIWTQRIKGPFSASPIIADGKAYVANEHGVVAVVAVGAEPKILAENDMKQVLLATPSIAGGALYLRSDQTLYCVEAKKEK